MPIPKDITQDKIIINGQKAIDLGRTPKIVKPWKEEKTIEIDLTTFKIIEKKE